MLPAAGGAAPPAPAGYAFAGFMTLGSKTNGGGVPTPVAVYVKQ
jgi:hypothetical protein